MSRGRSEEKWCNINCRSCHTRAGAWKICSNFRVSINHENVLFVVRLLHRCRYIIIHKIIISLSPLPILMTLFSSPRIYTLNFLFNLFILGRKMWMCMTSPETNNPNPNDKPSCKVATFFRLLFLLAVERKKKANVICEYLSRSQLWHDEGSGDVVFNMKRGIDKNISSFCRPERKGSKEVLFDEGCLEFLWSRKPFSTNISGASSEVFFF